MDKLEKPIRVIHVTRTLSCKQGGIHFTRPRDWGFHVLSHTWSALVRQMSERIGLGIGAQVGVDQDAYSLAFQRQDFRQEPCYPHLMEVFQMLHNDGVQFIWFDALCINQTLVEEKSHEINNMGGYFSLGEGTYVLGHGFGKVNEMWGESTGVLPRWFSRVWTFQEFLLPRKVSFLVDGAVDHRFVAVVNELIREKAKTGLCKCFLNTPSAELDELLFRSLKDEDLKWMGGFELRNPQWKSIMHLTDERSPCDSAREDDDQVWTVGPTCYKYLDTCCKLDTRSNKLYLRDLVQEKQLWHGKQALWEMTNHKKGKSIICGESSCVACGSRPMIRQAKRFGQKQTSYFFDREVYLALMQCHSRMIESGSNVDEPSSGIQVLRGLYCALATEGNWRPCHVICEVGWRDCTNEEDRVLAILGLLGLKLKKLRTGKALTEQILELAKVGGSAMLVELCMVNQKGSVLPHMSWAPDFYGQNKKLEHANRPKEVHMKVEKLQASGHLQVNAKVVHGRVVIKNTLTADQADQGRDYYLTIEAQHSTDCPYPTIEANCPPLPLRREVKSRDSETLLLISHFDFLEDNMREAGSFEVPIQASTACKELLVSFPVELLLAGIDEQERKLLLICVPNQLCLARKELHKIGCMALDNDVHTSLHHLFDSCDMQDWVIGGFGEDLTKYICVN